MSLFWFNGVFPLSSSSSKRLKGCEFIISVCGEGIEGDFSREKSVIMVSGGREGHVGQAIMMGV